MSGMAIQRTVMQIVHLIPLLTDRNINVVIHEPHGGSDRKNGELFGCTVKEFHAVLVRAGITPDTCKPASKAKAAVSANASENRRTNS